MHQSRITDLATVQEQRPEQLATGQVFDPLIAHTRPGEVQFREPLAPCEMLEAFVAHPRMAEVEILELPARLQAVQFLLPTSQRGAEAQGSQPVAPGQVPQSQTLLGAKRCVEQIQRLELLAPGQILQASAVHLRQGKEEGSE